VVNVTVNINKTGENEQRKMSEKLVAITQSVLNEDKEDKTRVEQRIKEIIAELLKHLTQGIYICDCILLLCKMSS